MNHCACWEQVALLQESDIEQMALSFEN